jgi:hypothetical protein
MVKKLLFIGAVAALFFGKAPLPVQATEDTSIPETPSSEVIPDADAELADVWAGQLEAIEGIIIALMVSFTGTGTIALIGRVAISKLTKKMTDKVNAAEVQNKLSTEQAAQAMQSILAFEQILQAQVSTLDKTVQELIQNQNVTNESIIKLLDEYKARDQQIKDLIVKEFGDDLE